MSTNTFDFVEPTDYDHFGKGMDRHHFEEAAEFDRCNPAVWRLFVRFAMEAKNAGREYLGAKMVMERIRWHSSIETHGGEFKINNNVTAYYSRKFGHTHPELGEFFRTRTTTETRQ